ncbi:MAG TPA: hypothetical protein IAC49_05325 [Candidatus Ventricola intestinavium]|nr:hypothetical protein [Candidatus Ventricola intestinavium]
MCKSRYYDAIAIGVSILVGVLLTILSAFNLITAGLLAPLFGILLGAFALLLLTLGAVSLLRQNHGFNQCVYQCGKRLLLPALWLVIVCAFTLLFALTNLIIGLILAFLIFTLISLTLFGLYCFLSCLIRAGHENSSCQRS